MKLGSLRRRKTFFKECHLAGRQYHDADEVWQDLQVGTLLKLERDFDNRYDDSAVAVVYEKEVTYPDGETCMEEFVIGYIPASQNKEIALFLEMGWYDIFECRISMINPNVHYEQQIHISIRIKENPVQIN